MTVEKMGLPHATILYTYTTNSPSSYRSTSGTWPKSEVYTELFKITSSHVLIAPIQSIIHIYIYLCLCINVYVCVRLYILDHGHGSGVRNTEGWMYVCKTQVLETSKQSGWTVSCLKSLADSVDLAHSLLLDQLRRRCLWQSLTLFSVPYHVSSANTALVQSVRQHQPSTLVVSFRCPAYLEQIFFYRVKSTSPSVLDLKTWTDSSINRQRNGVEVYKWLWDATSDD